jgi:hypothetical protein
MHFNPFLHQNVVKFLHSYFLVCQSVGAAGLAATTVAGSVAVGTAGGGLVGGWLGGNPEESSNDGSGSANSTGTGNEPGTGNESRPGNAAGPTNDGHGPVTQDDEDDFGDVGDLLGDATIASLDDGPSKQGNPEEKTLLDGPPNVVGGLWEGNPNPECGFANAPRPTKDGNGTIRKIPKRQPRHMHGEHQKGQVRQVGDKVDDEKKPPRPIFLPGYMQALNHLKNITFLFPPSPLLFLSPFTL